MKKTYHFQQRLSQRGIRTSFIDLLNIFGLCDGDKISLSKKNCLLLSRILADTKRNLDKMAEKGGYSMVAVDDVLITAYRINSFRRSARQKSCESEGDCNVLQASEYLH